MIEFDNVSKRFTLHKDQRNSIQERVAGLFRPRVRGEEFWALRDISFRVGEGQSLGLVGHNGAGKSTALKLMTRIPDPTSGTVRLKGRVAALLELGSGFHPDLSGRENVLLNGSLMGFSRRAMQSKPGRDRRVCRDRRFHRYGGQALLVGHSIPAWPSRSPLRSIPTS